MVRCGTGLWNYTPAVRNEGSYIIDQRVKLSTRQTIIKRHCKNYRSMTVVPDCRHIVALMIVMLAVVACCFIYWLLSDVGSRMIICMAIGANLSCSILKHYQSIEDEKWQQFGSCLELQTDKTWHIGNGIIRTCFIIGPTLTLSMIFGAIAIIPKNRSLASQLLVEKLGLVISQETLDMLTGAAIFVTASVMYFLVSWPFQRIFRQVMMRYEYQLMTKTYQ